MLNLTSINAVQFQNLLNAIGQSGGGTDITEQLEAINTTLQNLQIQFSALAENVSLSSIEGLTATNVQEAISELNSSLKEIKIGGYDFGSFSGEKEMTIEFGYTFKSQPRVFISPSSSWAGGSDVFNYIISSVTNSSFTIRVNNKSNFNIKISWLAIA